MSLPDGPREEPCGPWNHSYFPNRAAAQAWCDRRKAEANLLCRPIICPRCQEWRTWRVS